MPRQVPRVNSDFKLTACDYTLAKQVVREDSFRSIFGVPHPTQEVTVLTRDHKATREARIRHTQQKCRVRHHRLVHELIRAVAPGKLILVKVAKHVFLSHKHHEILVEWLRIGEIGEKQLAFGFGYGRKCGGKDRRGERA